MPRRTRKTAPPAKVCVVLTLLVLHAESTCLAYSVLVCCQCLPAATPTEPCPAVSSAGPACLHSARVACTSSALYAHSYLCYTQLYLGSATYAHKAAVLLLVPVPGSSQIHVGHVTDWSGGRQRTTRAVGPPAPSAPHMCVPRRCRWPGGLAAGALRCLAADSDSFAKTEPSSAAGVSGRLARHEC